MSKILLISDLHVGSRYAVAPNNFHSHKNNRIQQAIYKQWQQMAKQSKYDYVIINGDVVDGTQRFNEGSDTWTCDLDEQIEAAIQLLNEIVYDKLLVTYGSPYHTKENLNCDQVFAKEASASVHNHELHFQPVRQNDIFHISHAVGVSTASWQYRTTPLAKELVAALLNEKELFKYRGIIRSHAHYYCKVNFSSSFALITPCWQTRTPYMIRKGLSLIPKLGWITLDNELDVWRIQEHCFNMPRPTKVII